MSPALTCRVGRLPDRAAMVESSGVDWLMIRMWKAPDGPDECAQAGRQDLDLQSCASHRRLHLREREVPARPGMHRQSGTRWSALVKTASTLLCRLQRQVASGTWLRRDGGSIHRRTHRGRRFCCLLPEGCKGVLSLREPPRRFGLPGMNPRHREQGELCAG